jgi:hypothetical protein
MVTKEGKDALRCLHGGGVNDLGKLRYVILERSLTQIYQQFCIGETLDSFALNWSFNNHLFIKNLNIF